MVNEGGVMRVVAVVVTYHPDLVVLGRLLDRIRPQLDGIVVVDNGSAGEVAIALAHREGENLRFVALGENKGIAAAQNEGIACARTMGASHVILFDHDSQPAEDMLKKLQASLLQLESAGRRVASIGPCYVDDRQANPPPFIRVRGLKLERCLVPENGDAVAVDYLIASGCLIPLAVLDDVGGMDASLFIDYVDIEWGQRARSKGYENFGCFSACMRHSLGDEPILFMGKAYPAHSPLRHYYLFRNAVLLYRMKHVPTDWKWADGIRLALKYGFYTRYSKPRLKHFMMMSKGLWHGLLGRTGKYEQACRGGRA